MSKRALAVLAVILVAIFVSLPWTIPVWRRFGEPVKRHEVTFYVPGLEPRAWETLGAVDAGPGGESYSFTDAGTRELVVVHPGPGSLVIRTLPFRLDTD